MPEARDYTVSAGESIPSIAKDNGFFWKTIWEHGKNAELKSKRQDPNVLFEGDIVHIPALEKKQESRATEAKHEFKRKGDPLKFRMQLRRFGEPRANEDYVLELGGKLYKGKTNGEGKIEQWMPGNVTSGKLLMDGGKEEYPLSISRLDPVDKADGVRQRLQNLGFNAGSGGGDELDDMAKSAIREFQKNNLNVTGALDDALKNKLKSLHP